MKNKLREALDKKIQEKKRENIEKELIADKEETLKNDEEYKNLKSEQAKQLFMNKLIDKKLEEISQEKDLSEKIREN